MIVIADIGKYTSITYYILLSPIANYHKNLQKLEIAFASDFLVTSQQQLNHIERRNIKFFKT